MSSGMHKDHQDFLSFTKPDQDLPGHGMTWKKRWHWLYQIDITVGVSKHDVAIEPGFEPLYIYLRARNRRATCDAHPIIRRNIHASLGSEGTKSAARASCVEDIESTPKITEITCVVDGEARSH